MKTIPNYIYKDTHTLELYYQTAFAYRDHLAKLLEDNNSDTIKLSKKNLYKDFVYPNLVLQCNGIFNTKNYDSIDEAAICAKNLGLIEIDETTKPSTYSLSDTKANIVLRPYQIKIIDTVSVEEKSVLIEVPTGGGKSVIASEIAKEEIEKGGKVLIVAPKIILLEQLEATFESLEPQIIHGTKDYDSKHSVFISTLQTAHKRDLGFEPTMIIIDEVHFGFSGKMIKELLKDFDGRLIGLSATPYDQDSQPIQGFDKHIKEYDLNYMFKYDYLVKPICTAPVKVELDDISIQAGDYNQKELDNSFNNFKNIMEIVDKTKETIQQQKAALIFCINIQHANAIAAAYNGVGIPTKAIHSDLSKTEQASILQEYKDGKIKMLANPMLLTTGFDDPATDCIILARATKSQNLYRQMVGRGLRLCKNKDNAKIIDCANVIDNLGLPTEPQEPNDQPFSKRERHCSKCKNTRVYRVKNYHGDLVLKCADCGNEDSITKRTKECENCGTINDSKSKYIMKDDDLYLECSICKHQSVISSKSTQEDMTKILNNDQISDIQKKYTIEYLTKLYDHYPLDLPMKKEVREHIKAFQIYIEENLVEFMPGGAYDIAYSFNYQPFKDSKELDPIDYQREWHEPRSWKTDGRLFGIEFEAQLLGTNVKKYRDDIDNILDNPISVLELINKLRRVSNQSVLDYEDKNRFIKQLDETSIKNINSMCTQRLKDIFHKQESIENILQFIPMMESVMNQHNNEE